jgi:hypothetical protein
LVIFDRRYDLIGVEGTKKKRVLFSLAQRLYCPAPSAAFSFHLFVTSFAVALTTLIAKL